ncbi:MAG TPA: NAD(P)/FAD-dependent oxidoreductase, partial [Acidimicrobiia bacterium]|nr:NAD(P)/FAD-dependent oxidoreductase [Acidimicrobiia bacterium]
MADVDAVVIGAGPNGLVAANLLADAGWRVLVLEAQPEPGGAVRSAELTHPGFVHDLCSAFYPLGLASPVMRALDLPAHGLRWRHAPLVLAHPTADGRCAALSTDVDVTAASLDEYAPGDGDAWREFDAGFRAVSGPLLDAMTSPIPPVKGATRLAAKLGPRGLLEFTRLALLSARRMSHEQFAGEGAAVLLTGNAMHADLGPDVPPGGFLGWMLTGLGQEVGFPVPEGGAGQLTAALVNRLTARGGIVRCNAPVVRIDVRDRRAVAVVLADGETIGAPRGVLADVGAPALYRELVGEEHLPAQVVADLERFQYDPATFKVDWALSGSIPWRNEAATHAGTVHVCDGMDGFTQVAADLAQDRIPARPFVLVGQMNKADPTRSPAGTETVWAYTHVPLKVRADAGGDLTGKWDTAEVEAFADRVEAEIEGRAPGFRALVTGRHVLSPPALEAGN